MCIQVPEYAIRLNNMTLDERIAASIFMDKFTKVGKNFEDSEEKDIFQAWLFNNRTPYEDKYRALTRNVREAIHDELTEKKVA